jgi:hypothetical protein
MSDKLVSVRKGERYKEGELEVILSLAPTGANIGYLSALLGRSREAIELVYRIAFEHGPFARTAASQRRKIVAAKEKVGIVLGPFDVGKET